MESRIGQKNTELTNLILTDTERTTLKEERAQLERSLDKLQSEKTHLIATEETRINREADGYKKIMEKSKDRIESFE